MEDTASHAISRNVGASHCAGALGRAAVVRERMARWCAVVVVLGAGSLGLSGCTVLSAPTPEEKTVVVTGSGATAAARDKASGAAGRESSKTERVVPPKPVKRQIASDRARQKLLGDVTKMLDRGDVDAAFVLLSEATARYPDDVDLAAARADVALELGDSAAALASYKAAASAAVAAADYEAAQTYHDLVFELASEPPEWALARQDDMAGVGDESAMAEAAGEWEILREQRLAALDAGDGAQAVALAEQALDLTEEAFGANHYFTLVSLQEAAESAYLTGDTFAAESLLLQARERATAALGAEHPDTIAIGQSLAQVYAQSQAIDRALEVLRELDAPLAKGVGAQSPLGLSVAIDKAQALQRSGFFDEGTELLASTCEQFRRVLGTWHPQVAECLNVLGSSLAAAGDLDGGGRAYAGALAILDAVAPGSGLALTTRAESAEVSRLQGRYPEVLRVLTAAERDAENLGDGEVIATVRGLRGRVLEDLGRFDEALAAHLDVLEYRIATVGEDSPEALGALNFVAGVQSRVGDFAGAEESYRSALNGYQVLYGAEDPATIAVMNNLGVVLEQMGMYDDAEPVLRTALNNAEKVLGRAHPTTLRNMNNLALLYEAQGIFDRAEPLYALPAQVLEAELGADHPDTIAVVNNLAFLKLMREDFPGAAQGFERAFNSWRGSLGPAHQNTLKAHNNLGRALLGQGRADEAQQVFAQTRRARTEALGPRHIDTQRSRHDLGRALFAQGRLADAETELRETLALNNAELGAQHPYTFETINALAAVLAAQGRNEEAFELRRTGYQRRTEFLDRMLWVTSENAREGYVRLHRPELDQYLNLAVSTLSDEVAGRELLDVSLNRKGLLLRIASEVQQIASMELDPAVSESAAKLIEARKKLAAVTLSGPKDQTGDQHLRVVRDLEREVEELEGELGRTSALYRESIVKSGVPDLVNALPDNASLVDFFVYEDAQGTEQLAAGVLSKPGGKAVLRHTVTNYAAVADAIDEYREVIQDEDADDDDVMDIGVELYEMLWAPIAAMLPDGPVYVVPDGQLNILPFDALPNEDGQYLLTTTDLHILSSSRDLLRDLSGENSAGILLMAGPDYDTEEVAGTTVLAAARSRQAARSRGVAGGAAPEQEELAGPDDGTRGARGIRLDQLRGISLADIDSRSSIVKASLRAASAGMRGLRFAPLPGAEKEGRLIDEQAEKAGLKRQFFTKIDAEEGILAALDAPPEVLHIATHGFFLKPNDQLRRRLLAMQRGADIQVPPPGDNPLLRAGLAFAGINSNAPFLGDIDTNNDGVLTALEVLGLNLSGTKLAVLSACETGLGEVHVGEGVYGLRRAFKEAGVEEIVMSLWEVSDAGTQALMTEMYERLLAGATPRVALRDAQKVLLKDPRWGYPYIWAAFTVVGK